MNNCFSLNDPRLRLAASLVRDGARFADIGTDHAHLPLYLLSQGRIASAVAADVAEGPLSRARENVRASGYEGRITLLLADGLSGMEGLGLTDIAICGMGGELIASILEAAPFVRDPAIRLILQPMTRLEELRRYLGASGFAVTAERYTVAGGRPYACLVASYTGDVRKISAVEAVLGASPLRDPADATAFLAFLTMREREAKARIRGRLTGGADISADEELIAAIAVERETLV